MRQASVLELATVFFVGMAVCGAQAPGTAVHFVNGIWFNGAGFQKNDFYAVGGVFAHKAPAGATVETVDLRGGFVVPPYGDAHEHNFDSVANTSKVAAEYMRDGIFYAQGMTDTPEGAAAVVKGGMVDTASTPDVTYAHGGLTGVNGHPKDVYESLVNGFYYPRDEAQRALVIGGHKAEGQAYWEIGSKAELEAKWPRILAGRPDQIKVYLGGSETFKQATAEDPQFARGIDPKLVQPIVERAHAAGLRVFAHIDTATDYHEALEAGVDGMAHLPGYGLTAAEDATKYRISDADIALTAKRHVTVQATASIADGYGSDADKAARIALAKDNLRRMKAAGVMVLVGSDRYGSDSKHEADYLEALGVWTNAEILRMWAVTTPQAIFPRRKIGEFKDGDEASLLVLTADPTTDWAAAHGIAGRWKQGVRVTAAQ